MLQEPVATTNALAILLLIMPMLMDRRSMTIPEVVDVLQRWGYPGAADAAPFADIARKIGQENGCFAFDDETDTIAPFSTSHLARYATDIQASMVAPRWIDDADSATEAEIHSAFASRGVTLHSREAEVLLQNAPLAIEPASSHTPDIAPFEVTEREFMRFDPLMLALPNRQNLVGTYNASFGLREIETLLSLPQAKAILSLRDRLLLVFTEHLIDQLSNASPPSRSDRLVEMKLYKIIRAFMRRGFYPHKPYDEVERDVIATARAESIFAVGDAGIRIDRKEMMERTGEIIVRPLIQELLRTPIDKRILWRPTRFVKSAVAGRTVVELIPKLGACIQAALAAPHATSRLSDHDLLALGMLLSSMNAAAAGRQPLSFLLTAASHALRESGFSRHLSISDLAVRLRRAVRLGGSFILSNDARWFGLRQVGKTNGVVQRILNSLVVENLFLEAQRAGHGGIEWRPVPPLQNRYARRVEVSELRNAIGIAHVPEAGITLGDLLLIAFAMKAARGEALAHEVGAGSHPDSSVITLEELRYALIVVCRMSRVLNPRDILACAGKDPRFSLDADGRRARLVEPHALAAGVDAILCRSSVNEILLSTEPKRYAADAYGYWGNRIRVIVPEGELLDSTPIEYLKIMLASSELTTLISDELICILAATVTTRGHFSEATKLSIDELVATCLEDGFREHMPYSRFVVWISDVIRESSIFEFSDDGETILIRKVRELYETLTKIGANGTMLEQGIAPAFQRKAKSNADHSPVPIHSSAGSSKGPGGALQARPSSPQPTLKAARAVPVKPPELPAPPPFSPNTVDFARILETELLTSHEHAVIPRMRIAQNPVRPTHARACAEKFVLRNGTVELGQVSAAMGEYLVARVFFSVNADKVVEAEAIFAVSDDGGAPDASSIIPASMSDGIGHDQSRRGLPSDMSGWIATRLQPVLERASNMHVREIFVRYAAEQTKLISRFAALAAALAPSASEVDSGELARLAAVRDDAISELGQRFRVGVSVTRMLFSWVEVPVALVVATLRRRKTSRTILLRVPAGANAVDSIRCETCNHTAKAPMACDGALHLLCEQCAPSLVGRIACPLCD